jgi:hypothetical protein
MGGKANHGVPEHRDEPAAVAENLDALKRVLEIDQGSSA